MTARPADKGQEGQGGAYQAEHWLAWALAALALVFALMGLLVGFGVIGEVAVQAGAEAEDPQRLERLGLWDAAVWFLPAIAAALLSLGLHQSDHHRLRDPDGLSDAEKGIWTAEHTGAWVMALLTVVLGAMTLLIGFDLFDQGYDQADGILWGLAALVPAILVVTLHAVRHHQVDATHDVTVAVVEQRVDLADRTPASLPAAGERGSARR